MSFPVYHRMMVGKSWVAAVVMTMVAAVPGIADETAALCGPEAYGRAVCLYDAGAIDEAAAMFQAIASVGETTPETVRSWYFLARIRMKQGQWEEASRNLVVVYRMSKSFYREWGCDHLLGQCREALGKG